MSKMEVVEQKLSGIRAKLAGRVNSGATGYEKFKNVVGIIVMVFYRLRKIFLALPVVYYALKLAKYNMENLPQQVGINLQANGVFADTISRELAVTGPLGLTAACLVLMLFSRKALYPWAVSIFTLVLPVLLLLSNLYPA